MHDDRVVDTQREVLRSELVNPDADPGALYLDSNFQPDPDYGRTQTVYLVRETVRCGRCGLERTAAREIVEVDPP